MNGFITIRRAFYVILVLIFSACGKLEVTTKSMSVEGGEEVEFTVIKDWGFGSNSNVLWEFGDGTISEERSPTHVYTLAGNYTVRLSEYSKSGRLKRKITPYIVEVTQLYKPRVRGLSAETESLDYIYTDLDTYLYTLVHEEVDDNIDDYTFEITVNGSHNIDARGGTHVFTDTGYNDVQIKIFDKNGVSGTYDTIMAVGGETSYLRFQLTDANLAPLGTITESYLIIYRNELTLSYTYDKQDFLDYPGPGATNSLINNGELMSYYGPGYNDYFYWDFEPFDYMSLSTVNDGDFYQIGVLAHDGSYIDYDDLRVIHLVVGTNGINMSELPFLIQPGLTTEVFDLPTPTFYPY